MSGHTSGHNLDLLEYGDNLESDKKVLVGLACMIQSREQGPGLDCSEGHEV